MSPDHVLIQKKNGGCDKEYVLNANFWCYLSHSKYPMDVVAINYNYIIIILLPVWMYPEKG